MKSISILFLSIILFSCQQETKIESHEIWEYDSDGKLIAISNFKKKNNENHLINKDGFEFLETYTLQEIKPILSSLKNLKFSQRESGPEILYATKKEKASTLKALLSDSIRTNIPDDLEFKWSMNPEQLRIDNKISTDLYFALYAVKKPKFEKEKMTGFDISKARDTINEKGELIINLDFTQSGSKKLIEMSSKNTGKFVAISFKKEVIMAPMFINTIRDGKLVISNSYASHIENKKLVQSINQFVRNGEMHLFYPNGKLREVRQYENGIQVGEYTKYDLNGKKIRTYKVL